MTVFSPQLYMTGHLLSSHSFAPSPQEHQGMRSCDKHPTSWHCSSSQGRSHPKRDPFTSGDTHGAACSHLLELGAATLDPQGCLVLLRLQTTRAAPPERAGMKTQQIVLERDTVTGIGAGVRQRVKIIGCIFHSDRMFYSCRIFIARNIVYQDIN